MNNRPCIAGSRTLARGALFLALGIIVQALRIFPLPPFLLMLVIGIGVNLALLAMMRQAGIAFALFGGILIPCSACLLGQLPSCLFFPAIALGNAVFLLCACRWWTSRLVWVAPLVKMVVLLLGAWGVLLLLNLPQGVREMVIWMMSLPQIITAELALYLEKKLEKAFFYNKND